MNRIILIGNGFDLAHGLKTSYKDFIDDYLSSIKDNIIEKKIEKNDGWKNVSYDEYFYEDDNLILEKPLWEFPTRSFSNWDIIVNSSFKNKFLEHILKLSLNNWVDIEEEYFNQIKFILDGKSFYKDSEEKKSIQLLNDDFQRIKDKLLDYLKTTYEFEFTCFKLSVGNLYSYRLDIPECRIPTPYREISDIKKDIYSSCNLQDFTAMGQETLFVERFYELNDLSTKIKEEGLEEIPNVPPHESDFLIDWLKNHFQNDFPTKEEYITFSKERVKTRQRDFSSHYPKNYIFLNFNYTYTERLYFYDYALEQGIDVIHIHGELENLHNPIIFGYGDETGKEYSEIEDLNDNNFLENVKSIKYSETQNYRKLLECINSDKYQIYIMGHSCGISDRTLLKTLFEHENCVSIKIRMYKYKDSEGNEIDNFSKIVRNISRHFSDKALMREKLTNKEYC